MAAVIVWRSNNFDQFANLSHTDNEKGKKWRLDLFNKQPSSKKEHVETFLTGAAQTHKHTQIVTLIFVFIWLIYDICFGDTRDSQ